jgi:hypothetical protein
MIGQGSLLLVVYHLFAILDSNFSFMGGVAKKQISKFRCEMFLQGHILITASEMLVVTCFLWLVYCGFLKQTKQLFIILICCELLLGHHQK